MRGAEDLELVKDSQVRDADIGYITQHNLTTLMRETMEALLIHRPAAPIPFMIDCFSMGPRLASQDSDLGIAVWRKEELQRCFSYITQVSIPFDPVYSAQICRIMTHSCCSEAVPGYST